MVREKPTRKIGVHVEIEPQYCHIAEHSVTYVSHVVLSAKYERNYLQYKGNACHSCILGMEQNPQWGMDRLVDLVLSEQKKVNDWMKKQLGESLDGRSIRELEEYVRVYNKMIGGKKEK